MLLPCSHGKTMNGNCDGMHSVLVTDGYESFSIKGMDERLFMW